MDGSLGKQYLKDYVLQTYPILKSILDNEVSKAYKKGRVFHSLVEHFEKIALGGKAIRPALINLGYLVCGGDDEEEIKKTSLFIEIFHTGILVHDDFMDGSDTRRGLVTVHKKLEEIARDVGVPTSHSHYGNCMAVNVGDLAYFLSWEILLKANFPFERIKKASEIFSTSAKNLVYGQVLDLTLPAFRDIEEKDVLSMLWTKSGDYTAQLPLTIGAALAGETKKDKLEAIKDYAKCLGWAFQIQDDILGAFGDEKEVGKPVGSDFKEGKNTLLVLFLRKNGTKKQKKLLAECLGNQKLSDNKSNELRQALKDSGAYNYVINKGWEYVEEGKKYIKQITREKNLQDILESLLVYMMERTK